MKRKQSLQQLINYMYTQSPDFRDLLQLSLESLKSVGGTAFPPTALYHIVITRIHEQQLGKIPSVSEFSKFMQTCFSLDFINISESLSSSFQKLELTDLGELAIKALQEMVTTQAETPTTSQPNPAHHVNCQHFSQSTVSSDNSAGEVLSHTAGLNTTENNPRWFEKTLWRVETLLRTSGIFQMGKIYELSEIAEFVIQSSSKIGLRKLSKLETAEQLVLEVLRNRFDETEVSFSTDLQKVAVFSNVS